MGCSAGKETAPQPQKLPKGATLLAAADKNESKALVKAAASRLPVGSCKSFSEHKGRKMLGQSILIATMPPEDAKCKAITMQGCTGFTFCGSPTDYSVKIYFKNSSQWESEVKPLDSLKTHAGVPDFLLSRSEWTSYVIAEESCTVGDRVMAIFAPTGKRYAAEIESVGADNTITVDWTDGGKTHRVLPFSSVTRDYVDTRTDIVTDGAHTDHAEQGEKSQSEDSSQEQCQMTNDEEQCQLTTDEVAHAHGCEEAQGLLEESDMIRPETSLPELEGKRSRESSRPKLEGKDSNCWQIVTPQRRERSLCCC